MTVVALVAACVVLPVPDRPRLRAPRRRARGPRAAARRAGGEPAEPRGSRFAPRATSAVDVAVERSHRALPPLRSERPRGLRGRASAPGPSPATGGAASTTRTGMLHAALDAGINFIDTAPVYGDDGVGETLLADVLKSHRDEIVLTTKCGYDIDAERKYPGPVGAPARLAARSRSARSSKTRCAGSAPTTSTSTSCTTRASSRSSTTTSGRSSRRSAPRARSASSASRSVRRSAGSRKASTSIRRPRRSCRCRPCSTCSSRSPASRSRPSPRVADGRVGLISRVPHASDTLSGKVTPDTVFPPGDHRAHRNRDNMLDNFEKAETLAFLWEGTGRTIGQAAIAGILANPAFTTVLPDRAVDVDDVREYAAASDLPLTDRRARAASTSCGHDNFDVTQPLRDAAEVERRRVTALVDGSALGSRPTSVAASCSTSRASSSPSAASTPRRWTTSRRRPASPSPSSTSTSRRSGRCSSRCSKTSAAGCSTVLTEATEQRRRPAATRVEAGLRRLLPVRRGRPRRVPPAVRRVGPQRPRVRRRRRRRARRRRRRGRARSSRSTARRSTAACSRTRSSGMAEAISRHALTDPDGPARSRPARATGSPSSRGSGCAACAPKTDRRRRASQLPHARRHHRRCDAIGTRAVEVRPVGTERRIRRCRRGTACRRAAPSSCRPCARPRSTPASTARMRPRSRRSEGGCSPPGYVLSP